MLFDGAIRFLEHALTGFHHDDPCEFNLTINNNVQRAQAIVDELNSSLDMSRGGELSRHLRTVYTYIDRPLDESNRAKTPDGIRDSIERLASLRSAWAAMLAGDSEPAASLTAAA